MPLHLFKRYAALLGAAALLIAAFGSGCRHDETPAPPSGPPTITPRPNGTAETGKPPEGRLADVGSIKEAITALVSQPDAPGKNSPFPKGVQVAKVEFQDGLVTLDFSKEFNALMDAGESVESEVQKALRAKLAEFSNVQRLRVTVEGQPFASQATDWNTPFPVRDADIKREAPPRRLSSDKDGGHP